MAAFADELASGQTPTVRIGPPREGVLTGAKIALAKSANMHSREATVELAKTVVGASPGLPETIHP